METLSLLPDIESTWYVGFIDFPKPQCLWERHGFGFSVLSIVLLTFTLDAVTRTQWLQPQHCSKRRKVIFV
jgi:hypothetical protein